MIGRAAMKRSTARGWVPRAAIRRASTLFAESESSIVGDLSNHIDWSGALHGMDAVVHIAGLAHAAHVNPEDVHRVNVVGAARLAESSAALGVRSFVLLSTAKVHGNQSTGRPFRDDDIPSPADIYARSKWEGEQAVRRALAGTDVRFTVVRSPLVYGPEVKANFRSLIRLVDRGVPLPFAAIRNERSIVFTENLADLLLECASSPAAKGETFLASEGPPLSTPELIRRIARELGKPARLFGVPPAVLDSLCRITGQSRLAERLLSSFAVDGSRAHRLLNWSPPVSPSAGLRETISWYESLSLK